MQSKQEIATTQIHINKHGSTQNIIQPVASYYANHTTITIFRECANLSRRKISD
uniref:Uncharacterized protein n=1 Tax=Anguilla anguilla TaxID=7936 RepID=A0A0E9PVT8_ANGAN